MYGTAVPVRQPGHTRDTSVLPVPGYAPRTGGWSRHSARALVHVCSPCLPACPWPEHGRSLHVPYPHYNCTCTCACVKCNPTITHRAGRTRHDTCKNGETTDGEVQRRRAFSRKLGGIVQLLRFVCLSRVSGSPRWSRRRLGRVRRGRPLPSRPRGAVGSGAAAIESAADSVVSRSRGCHTSNSGHELNCMV